MMMRCKLFIALLLVFPAWGQLTVEPAGAPPSEGVSDSVKAVLAADGYRVKDAGGAVVVEVWPLQTIAVAKGSEERSADFASIPLGSLIGVIRYAKEGGDCRGQPIKPGVYTMRYQLMPEDGNHQGAAPRRDFLLLGPVSADQDAAAKLNYEAAVALSSKATGTPHPAVLYLALPGSGAKFPSVQSVDSRQVLQLKVGAVEMGINIVGKMEG